jgi:tetratricopeptide (TPR) repeat protein
MTRAACLLFLLGLPGLAIASDKPVFGPPEGWVKPTAMASSPAKGDASAPVGLLLEDIQIRFAPSSEATYMELAAKVQTPQGLQALGALAPIWNPETDTLTIHKVNILRGGKTINVFAGGHGFTVLRRESKLEQATLDGTLTAAMQIEDLRVGDVLDVAWTVTRSDPLLNGRIQEILSPNGPTGGRIRLRLIWPDGAGVKTSTSAWMPNLQTVSNGGFTTAAASLETAPEVVLPKDAPARFKRGREVEVSNFANWADVSALMAPLFDKAAVIPPGSPLEVEAKRIAATTRDPKLRTAQALALVQGDVRYVLLALNGGGLTPASAELTWARRFGDCKGKTALLLALLHYLGVEAEPALASTVAGDGLDQRLPMLAAFDHVIVHTRISGRDYWLDGTRGGDGPIDAIETPPFEWVLSVRHSGATLVHLAQAPLAQPAAETQLRLDASAGLVAEVKVRAETVLRGDLGFVLHSKLAQLTEDQRQQALRKFWEFQHRFGTIDAVSERYDAARKEEHVTADGSVNLDWSGAGLEAMSSRLATKPDLLRQAGPHQDAPYAIAFPAYERSTETVILPNAGKGFTLNGQNIAQTVAGVAYSRQASLSNGVVTVTATQRSLTNEFPAAQAPAVTAALADLSQRTLFIAPPGAKASLEAGQGPSGGATPTTAAAYIAQGLAFRLQNRVKDAMEAFDQALVLDPNSAGAAGGRAMMMAQAAGLEAKALAAADQALKLDPTQPSALLAKALLAERDHRWADEQAFLERSLKREASDPVALAMRAGLEAQDNQAAKARLDFAESRRFGAASPFALNLICYEAAMRDFELDKALGDCDAAVKLDPKAAEILDSRGFVLLRLKRDDDAITQYDAALAIEPFIAESLLGRSFAERRRGRASDAERDLQAALAANPKVADEFKRYGLTE